MLAAYDSGDWPSVIELVAPNARAYVGAMQADRDGWRAMGEMFAKAFPDAKHTVHAFHVAGEYATAVCTFKGTHRGAFMGIPATGRTIEFDVIHVDRVVDGRIVEHRGQFDSANLMQQLVPAADPLPLVREMFRRIDAQDQDGALALATPDFTFQFGDLKLDGPGWKGFSQGFFAGVPDGRHEFSELITQGDRVTGIGRFVGTHEGELMGLPATGRKFSLGYICVIQLRDGKLANIQVQADAAGMMQQLTA
jgi:steroid delta-isomerase-like uncharacterized protein